MYKLVFLYLGASFPHVTIVSVNYSFNIAFEVKKSAATRGKLSSPHIERYCVNHWA